MTDRLMQIAAFLVVAGFLGIVVWHVPRLDLVAAISITLAGIAYDFFLSPDGRRKRR
jgi:hypothetical protein